MRRTALTPSLVMLCSLAACGPGADSSNAPLETVEARASYGVGLNMGRQLQPAEGRLDMAAFQRGIGDAMAAREPALAPEEIDAALQEFSQSIQAAEQQRRDEQASANEAAGQAYLAENGARDGVTTTESGLQYEVLTAGSGARPSEEDRVSIHYEGTLVDGTVFDSSLERGTPAEFSVTGVIDGFTEAILLMQVGSKYRVVIPSDLAYGPQGGQPGGPIGPNATLIFEMELLEILP